MNIILMFIENMAGNQCMLGYRFADIWMKIFAEPGSRSRPRFLKADKVQKKRLKFCDHKM